MLKRRDIQQHTVRINSQIVSCKAVLRGGTFFLPAPPDVMLERRITGLCNIWVALEVILRIPYLLSAGNEFNKLLL